MLPLHSRPTRPVLQVVAALVVALATLAWPLSAGASVVPSQQAPRAQHQTLVSQIPISFSVRNVNRSDVPCTSDGGSYQVRGHLVGPARLLHHRRLRAATLYLHGLSFGEFFWRFQGDRGHDYAVQQARRQHVSVTIDRLGYGASDKSDGAQVCVGSRADMAHQMIQQLRSGHYRSDHGRQQTPRVGKVFLAGHSYGGQIANVEAYSFGDVAGILVLGYADRVQSQLLGQSAAYATQICSSGGLQVDAVGPGGYAPFGPPSGAPEALFHSASAPLLHAVVQQLTIDPCGDGASFAAATQVDLSSVSRITKPVLVVGGGADKLFPPPAAADQAELYAHSSDVSHRTIAGMAHAFTFERQEPELMRLIDRWLRHHGG